MEINPPFTKKAGGRTPFLAGKLLTSFCSQWPHPIEFSGEHLMALDSTQCVCVLSNPVVAQ